MTRAGIGVGGLRRRHLDGGEEVLNLYYRLAAAHHGRGLGKEAARAWTAHALEWLPPLPVVAKSREINERSLRAALAAGLEPAGTTDDGPEGEPPSTGAARAPGRVAQWFDEPDPRVGARPVVRGQRHRGSGRLPPGGASPRGRVDPGGARGGDGRRGDDAPCSCAGRWPGRGPGVLGGRPQPAARARSHGLPDHDPPRDARPQPRPPPHGRDAPRGARAGRRGRRARRPQRAGHDALLRGLGLRRGRPGARRHPRRARPTTGTASSWLAASTAGRWSPTAAPDGIRPPPPQLSRMEREPSGSCGN